MAARLAVFALAIGAFGIGTAEFATMGLLPQIAAGFDASLPEAGHAVSLYALGVVVGAPLITVLGAKVDRRRLLLGLMVVFVLGSIGSTLAPSLGALLGSGSSPACRTARSSVSPGSSPRRWRARSAGAPQWPG